MKQLSEESGIPVGLIHNWFVRRRRGSIKKSKPENVITNKTPPKTFLEEQPHMQKLMIAEDNVTDKIGDLSIQTNNDSNNISENTKKDKPAVMTRSQLKVLENAYKKEKYPDYLFKKKLAEKLKLTWKRINNWFKNKRKKETRDAMAKKKSFDDKDTQISIMENHYQECKIPSDDVITNIADTLKLDKKLIYDWFKSSQEEKQKECRNKRFKKTETQVHTMEKIYQESKYPPPEVVTELVKTLNLERKLVVKWFAHRRRKDKRAAHSSMAKGNIPVNVGTTEDSNRVQSACQEINEDYLHVENSTTENYSCINYMKQRLTDLMNENQNKDNKILLNPDCEDGNNTDIIINTGLSNSTETNEMQNNWHIFSSADNESKNYIDLEIKKEIMDVLTEAVENRKDLESLLLDVNKVGIASDAEYGAENNGYIPMPDFQV